jgi:hypothetical protein
MSCLRGFGVVSCTILLGIDNEFSSQIRITVSSRPTLFSIRTFCTLLCILALCVIAAQSDERLPSLKPVTIFVEGDSSVIPKFVNMCRQMGPDRGLDFHFVDRRDDKFDYHVVLSAEGSSAWDFAHGNIVVLNPEAKVLFTVTRANRWSAKGATSALTKEFVKVLARYIGTHD